MALEIAVYTVATQNYFHFAKTLMESIACHEWDAARYVFLVDGDPQSPDLRSDLFTTLSLADLFDESPKTRLFRYTALEMSASIKPLAMEYLFRLGHGKVVFLDADTLVLGPMDAIVSRLDHAEVLLTPHITEPLGDAERPNDLDIIRSGVMNAGFFAARTSRGTAAFLNWWQDKLASQCIKAIEESVHAEQKWLDLAPSLFSGVCIDRSPGLNVAYWNLAHRELAKRGSSYRVGDSAVIFFHFSGVLPENPSILSHFDGRFTAFNLPTTVASLLRFYIERLEHNGLDEYRHRPYGFDFFSDRITRIPPLVRRVYREHESIQETFGDDPFDESRDPGFVTTYNRTVRTGQPPLTWLAYEIYLGSNDLRARFPQVPGLDTRDYLVYLASVVAPQYALSEAFLKPLRLRRPNQSGLVLAPILRTARNLARQSLIHVRSGIDRLDPPHYSRSNSASSAPKLPQQAQGFHEWMNHLLGSAASRIRRTPWIKRAGRSMLDSIQSPPPGACQANRPAALQSEGHSSGPQCGGLAGSSDRSG